MAKKICILSIDGGGIRGILPGVIINYLEQELQKVDGANARISDYFDLIAGTSTGGILTCLYLIPDSQGRPKFTAQQAVDLYVKNGGGIFHKPFIYQLSNPLGLRKAMYPAKYLETILHNYFGDVKLSDTLKPCLITSYCTEEGKAIFFDKTDAFKSLKRQENDNRDFYLRDLARATSAAPTFFEPASITSIGGERRYTSLIDGGMVANNPALCAYIEANDLDFTKMLKRSDKPKNPDVNDVILVSIGTGAEGTKNISFKETKDWGKTGWIVPVFDVLFSGSAQTVECQLEALFQEEQYYRLKPLLKNASNEMDNASPENVAALVKDAGLYVENEKSRLNRLIGELLKNK